MISLRLKIMKRMYDVNDELFFKTDDSGGRQDDQKRFRRDLDLDVRKFAFSNRVADTLNLFSSQFVNAVL